jgi:23S rRNA pseudouridine2605 synthase
MDKNSVRLHVFLARAGIASRRKCEEFITEGKVKVNGRIVTELGTKIDPDDEVSFRNRRVYQTKLIVYIALNKPPKYLSTTKDPEGRPIALSLLRPKIDVRLYPVGRLDFLSSGLLFFTNDGDFAKRVSHPSSGIEKEYIVDTKKDIPEEFLKEYVKGTYVEGELYRLKSYKIRSPRSVALVLEEGKNREIRKVFSSRGLYPKRIHRIRIGSVGIKGIESGKFRHLTSKEVESFRKKE